MSNGGREESWEQRVDFREESTPKSSGWESVWVFGIQQINLLPSTVRSGGLYLSPPIVIAHVLWYLRAPRAVRPRQTRAGPAHYPSWPPGGALLSGISPGRGIGPSSSTQHSFPLPPLLLDGPFPCCSLSRPTCSPCTGLTSGVSPGKSSTLGASLRSEPQAGLGP